MSRLWRVLPALLGLALIAAYWYSVHPPGFSMPYTEDWCMPDLTRQLMAENLERFGAPRFSTERFSAPFGMSVPYLAWGVEASWLGAYFWKWAPSFPFLWAWFGVSLAFSYLGVGFILQRMKLGPLAAWGLALGAVLFHVPRHFKAWHHYEHLLQHWVYWGVFLDAWIWQRFERENRWSWSLDLWRGLALLGTLWTAGYFWGPMVLEWLLVRGWMWRLARSRRERGQAAVIEGSRRQAAPVLVLAAAMLALDVRWFRPLLSEASRLGSVGSGLGWFELPTQLVRPLWLDRAANLVSELLGSSWRITPYSAAETVVSAGWLLWVPAALGLALIRKKRERFRFEAAAPFVALLVVGVLYIVARPPVLQYVLQFVIPPMKFFRVASRWGLFLPEILVAITALCWPELRAWFAGAWSRRPRRLAAGLAAFAALSAVEASELLTPTTAMTPLPESTVKLLEGVRDAPGTTVLDLPFCLAGGNGVCTGDFCPNYPLSTTGACFRLWHGKSVFGNYSGRLVQKQCEVYFKQPYDGWRDSWRDQRCLKPEEWAGFCRFLDEHTELSAVLVYPDIWRAAGSPECRAQFEAHLGAPIAEGAYAAVATRGTPPPIARVLRYGTRCLAR